MSELCANCQQPEALHFGGNQAVAGLPCTSYIPPQTAAPVAPSLPPLGDRSHHFEIAEVMEAVGDPKDSIYQEIEGRLHLMTSGERYTLFRAIKKLVLAKLPAPDAQGGDESDEFMKFWSPYWIVNGRVNLPVMIAFDAFKAGRAYRQTREDGIRDGEPISGRVFGCGCVDECRGHTSQPTPPQEGGKA